MTAPIHRAGKRVTIVRLVDDGYADPSYLGRAGVIEHVAKELPEEGPWIAVSFEDGSSDDFYPDELALQPNLDAAATGAVAPHGTRARYVSGKCRCAPCTASNLGYYHARMARRREAAASVKPNGPPLTGVLYRAGKRFEVKRCPGAEGKRCVKGGAWLRVGLVCVACIERVTVWNGLVDTAPVRRHLKALSDEGVGYKAVADAASVAKTILQGVMSGARPRIRAQLARRVLGVDAAAAADGAYIDAAPTRKLVAHLLREGFTKAALAHRLGYASPALQLGRRGRIRADNALKVEKFYRMVMQG